MSKLADVLGGGQGLKGYAGQTLTISAFDVEEDEDGQESATIIGTNGDGSVRVRTTSAVVRKQLAALQMAGLLPATVQVDEVSSKKGRTYLSLSEPAD
jgi:hypothetical protein